MIPNVLRVKSCELRNLYELILGICDGCLNFMFDELYERNIAHIAYQLVGCNLRNFKWYI